MTSGRPVVIVVTGHPGSGKTTAASHIAGTLYIPLLSKVLVAVSQTGGDGG